MPGMHSVRVRDELKGSLNLNLVNALYWRLLAIRAESVKPGIDNTSVSLLLSFAATAVYCIGSVLRGHCASKNHV